MRLGIDLGGTKISGVVIDPTGVELARLRVATPQGDYPATLSAIVDLVQALLRQVGVANANVPLGIGTPGVLLANGRMSNCNSQCLNGQRLLVDLEERLQRPVRIANDADCFALAQSWLQIPQGVSVPAGGLLFGIILGTGVGGGWVHHGELIQGPNRLAGEWGHTPLSYFRADASQSTTLYKLECSLVERECYCGRKNCLETFLSGPGLALTHRELWDQVYSAQELAQLSLKESADQVSARQVEQARLSLDLYVSMLARSLAQVINSLDPACIVLGGGLSNIQQLYDQLPSLIPPSLFSREGCATPIVGAVGGDDSGLFGAASLFAPQGG